MKSKELLEANLPNLFKFRNGEDVVSEEQWKLRRNEIKDIISKCEYGNFPNNHYKVSSKIIKEDENYSGGTAIYKEVMLTMNMDEDFEFKIKMAIPKSSSKSKAFVYLDFYDTFPNKNLPVNEIIDNGFAIISVYYEDITLDNDDFEDGLSKHFKIYDKNSRTFGKILIWSFACMHIMDYIESLGEIDKNNIAIVGFSRLGKTALLTGAFDDRFKFVISNDSGQSGAAISKNKTGERIRDILTRFPYWFNSNYIDYIDKDENLEFDQHFLTSLIYPRYLYIASASEDLWADPKAEFRCVLETSKVYEKFGKAGLIYTKEGYPSPNDDYLDGDIGYHLRKGTHYLTRYDWQRFMKFINIHTK